MRKIEEKEIIEAVKNLFIEANFSIPDEITNSLECEKCKQKTDLASSVLDTIITNNNIAKSKKIPACQDTGMAVVFVKVGTKVYLDTEKDLSELINEGVRAAYSEGFLRMSVVKDPLNRINTNDNSPAIIYTEIVKGDKIEITALPKGFGSENMSKIKMFKPTATREEILDFIVSVVSDAGANPCPPVIVGVGIGGTFDYCAVLSKKALMRPINTDNAIPYYNKMEMDALEKINKLDIGVQGLGGPTTALKVNIEAFPTHIAGLPVAVNISCHVTRHKSITI